MNIQKTSQRNNSETVKNEHHKDIPKERYISPDKVKKVWSKINVIV